MGLIKTVIKGAVIAKVIQIAGRELSKPENQRKIREGLQRVSRTVRS